MPDKIDPPHATGAAADTVKKHSQPHELVFHAVRLFRCALVCVCVC